MTPQLERLQTYITRCREGKAGAQEHLIAACDLSDLREKLTPLPHAEAPPTSALTRYTTPDLWTMDGEVVPLESPRTPVYLASAVDAADYARPLIDRIHQLEAEVARLSRDLKLLQEKDT